MPDRLNQTELSLYSSQFASKIVEDFFKGKDFASGEDILSLTPVEQINHSLIQKLYGQWKKDAQEFRSPYFDFTNTEVIEALENFMNIVSRHIAVQKDDLYELLIVATDNTLMQLFEPLKFYSSKFNALPDLVVTAAHVKEINRFNKLHKKVLERLGEKISAHDSSTIYASQANRWLEELLEDTSLSENPEKVLAQLSEVVPFDLQKMTSIQKPEVTSIPPTEERSFFDYVQKTVEEPQKEPTTFERPILARPTIENTTHSTEISDTSNNREDQTLNNTFKSKSIDQNYGHQNIKIESIAGSIPLAQRFVYISQLFKGSADEFDQSIKMLDRCTSFTEAHEFIYKSLAHRYDWDTKSERVKELLVTVRRKFN